MYVKDTAVPSVHDERPAPRSTTIQTSKTHPQQHPITLTRGMRIIVTGKLRQRTFDDKEGQRRTTMEI
ncbi:single-stranded DNA-binding protein, partial [Streptomyces sioyaensis]|uniref:single-stranded DNA-binding protein n=1 Tax=Streptomyces sioyaensis TaxID=67364 RepID=UPI0033E42049